MEKIFYFCEIRSILFCCKTNFSSWLCLDQLKRIYHPIDSKLLLTFKFVLCSFFILILQTYRDAPLYLEWAPGDILCPSQKSEQDGPNNTVSDQGIKSVSLEQTLGGILEDDIDPDRVEV